MRRDKETGGEGSLRLLPMEERHLPALAELEKICFSEPWSEDGLRAELTNGTAHFLVAEQDGKVAGYAGMHGVCGEGYIANIAVFPAFRGRGIGRALLRGLVSVARGRQYEFITLEVRAGNRPAISLYESEGFCVAGVRRGFYSHPLEDGVIMTLFF